MKKNEKKSRKAEDGRAFRDRIKDVADNLKERAKNMNSEEKTTNQPQEDTPQEAQQEAAPQMTAEEMAAALAKAQAQCDEYLDLAQRKQAEFANYRRRTEGVRKEAYDEGCRDTVEKILPVVDNLERALAAGDEDSALHSGVEMVLRQTRETLEKMGVKEINPQGEAFDAQLMNAVMQGTAEEGEPGTVCMVLQKGYMLGERVIRHAMVKVVAG